MRNTYRPTYPYVLTHDHVLLGHHFEKPLAFVRSENNNNNMYEQSMSGKMVEREWPIAIMAAIVACASVSLSLSCSSFIFVLRYLTHFDCVFIDCLCSFRFVCRCFPYFYFYQKQKFKYGVFFSIFSIRSFKISIRNMKKLSSVLNSMQSIIIVAVIVIVVPCC